MGDQPCGRSAKAFFMSLYQPIDFLGCRQRPFIASRACCSCPVGGGRGGGLGQRAGVRPEAGTTGFGLARAFAAVGVRCEVVAPSKLERPPGDRVKTDRRDARRLARLLHIGEISGIRIPSVVEEDARDLVRAREDARADLMRARHRLSKLLLRHGIVYYGGKAWTGTHERWLRQQRFDAAGARAAFDQAFDPVLSVTARRHRLDEAIAVTAAQPPWAPIVSR